MRALIEDRDAPAQAPPAEPPGPDLTDEQRAAVSRRAGSLLLSAGAGSGKTSVLVERFALAVHEDGVTPGRILAVTFTERAAGELRERIRARLLQLGRRDAAREAESAFVGTIHGLCARLLRAHAMAAQVDPGFEVLDEGTAHRLEHQAFRDALGAFVRDERPQAIELAAAYGPRGLETIVLDAHAALRSQGEREPRLPLPVAAGDARAVEDRAAIATLALLDELLSGFGHAYAARKRARGALDFDDLELGARDLLRDRPEIRRAWAERFELVMVDEFQDTNPRQLELLGQLDRDNLFTVGDELQSIYGFRHADVGLFRERRERLAARGAALALTCNFRSRAPILAAVDRVFAERLGDGHAALSCAREGQAPQAPGRPEDGTERDESAVELLLTDCRGWLERGVPGFEGLPQATPWRAAEARLLAARVAELVHSHRARPGDVAVLLRAAGDMPLYEAALQALGMPTLAATGGFWGHRQVGDLLAYLRTLANPLDEPSLYSTLAGPLVGLSSDGLVLLSREARARERPVGQLVQSGDADAQALLGHEDRARLRRFCEWFAEERLGVALRPLATLLRRGIAAGGYEAYVRSLPWSQRRMANVHKLIRLARTYESQEGRDLRGFLEHAAHLGRAFDGREAEAPVAAREAHAVRLMSIHAAKGLEFPVVCVADLGRAPRLDAPDLIVERDGRVGLRVRDLEDPEPRAALEYESLRVELQAARQAEEDRILYVAMTRARDRLILSGAADFARWPSSRVGGSPMAWLAPALVPDAPALAEGGAHDALVQPVSDRLNVRCVFNRPDRPAFESGSRPVAQPAVAPSGDVAPTLTVRRLREPTPELAPLADPDALVSYSSLAELERCGYRHYLERVLGLKPAAWVAGGRAGHSALRARKRGTVIHALLESLDFTDPRAPDEKAVARATRAAGVRLSVAERREIGALLERALRTPPAGRIAAARRIRREHPFCFSVGPREPLVTGVLDLIASESDGTTLIVDYKSDRLEEGEDLERLVEREYRLQRLVYALAALEQGAERVEMAHWFLERPAELVRARYTAAQRPALREDLARRHAELRARGYRVADEPHRGLCLTCPGRAGLCSWSSERTLAESPEPSRLGEPLGSPRSAEPERPTGARPGMATLTQ